MTALPPRLLDAVWRAAAGDEAEANRLAERWARVLPEMEERTERIRAQVRDRVCVCQLEPESVTEDGRCCGRCFGRRRAAP